MTARIACVHYSDLGTGYFVRLAIAFSREYNYIVSLFSPSGQEECTWSDGDGVFVMLLSAMNIIVLFHCFLCLAKRNAHGLMVMGSLLCCFQP